MNQRRGAAVYRSYMKWRISESQPRSWLSSSFSSSAGIGEATIGTTGLPRPVDLLERYRSLVVLGRITYDEEQVQVVMQLRRLQKQLLDYTPPATAVAHLLDPNLDRRGSSNSMDTQHWWSYSPLDSELNHTPEMRAIVRRKSHAEELAALDTPTGLLLTGEPGSGKSFLIDLWFSTIPTKYKARMHYNELVLQVYRGVWEETRRRMDKNYEPTASVNGTTQVWSRSIRDHWRGMFASGATPGLNKGIIPLISTRPTIAFMVAQRLILNSGWLLVFDEIQLLDVSSATLLADVLSWFWRMGGVIVGTSNKVPDEYYKNGVQRERLEYFVEALKLRCPVTTMRSSTDWRQVRGKIDSGAGGTWYTLDQKAEYEKALALVSSPRVVDNHLLYVFGRPVCIPWSSGHACKFSFTDLCNKTLGPADYLTLASHYNTFIITDVPALKLSDKDQGRRFISLLDALYEARCRLICLAETQPEQLFFPDAINAAPENESTSADIMLAEAIGETQDTYRPNIISYGTPQMAEAPVAPAVAIALDTLSIFSGQDEQFAYKRALSRLIEMTSQDYALNETWNPMSISSRKWETAKGTSFASTITPASMRPGESQEDFAYEAAHPNVRGQATRYDVDSPRLQPHHVWGVRDDWGKGAKSWGQGAKAYEK